MLHDLMVLDVAAGARADETQIALLPLSASWYPGTQASCHELPELGTELPELF